MTDRFYPLGQPAEADVWKTTYEVQNEMRAFARSPFPPGTSIHQPGAREKFGFSSPGPLAHRLTRPDICLTEDVDVPNPREKHAVARVQVDDDRMTFEKHDTEEMVRSYRSPVAQATLTGSGGFGIKKTRSVPSLTKTMSPKKLSEAPVAVHSLEDDHFSYFVPKGQASDGREKMSTHSLTKLHKADRISFPHSGEGTGFRTQGGGSEWMPGGSYKDQPSSYGTAFAKPFDKRKLTVAGL